MLIVDKLVDNRGNWIKLAFPHKYLCTFEKEFHLGSHFFDVPTPKSAYIRTRLVRYQNYPFTDWTCRDSCEQVDYSFYSEPRTKYVHSYVSEKIWNSGYAS